MKKIFFVSSLILLLFSCKEKQSENLPKVDNAVDNAESSASSSITRFSKGGNIVHDIYNELMKKDKTLQDLNQRIISTNQKTDDVVSEYDAVINKSETYYSDATALASSITDSTAKKTLEKVIKASSDQYDLKIKHIRDLVDEIHKNRVKLHDEYIAFKIRKTLPEIEKYQQAHPVKTDSLDNFIKKQNALLNELKNLK